MKYQINFSFSDKYLVIANNLTTRKNAINKYDKSANSLDTFCKIKLFEIECLRIFVSERNSQFRPMSHDAATLN